MPKENATDHDLLITLNQQVKAMDEKLTAHLENNGETIKDHETRIRRLELWGGIALGAILLVEFITKTGLNRYL